MAWKPTHRHVKRGTTYEVVGEARMQSMATDWDERSLTIYRGEDGQLWARPTVEFNDGRFEPVVQHKD